MDEQMTAAQASNYDISADGAVNAGYEEEPITPKPEEPAQSEAEELAPDGIRLNDGEVEFGEEFFGDMKDQPEEEPKPEAPKYYTDEELDQIPFTQWDLSRLNGEVGRYAQKVQQQLQRQQEYARSQAWENAPLPNDITEPKAYTPQELSQEALKLACKKLGIEDTDEFDSYELDHKSAYELAAQELIQKRNAEMSGYQNALQSWRENARYQEELSRRPDFKEFAQWYLAQCRQGGFTPQQVDAGLYNMARQNGNNFGLIKQTMEGWYQTFKSQQAAKKPAQQKPRISRVAKPPVLESTRGNNYAGRASIRANEFAGMTDDEQAEALIKMGVV